MLRSGTKSVGKLRLFSVRYSILPVAVWCGAAHTCSHTSFIMVSESGHLLSLPFTSKTGQSVAQNRHSSFFLLY